MKQSDIESISNSLLDIFHGMMYGTISYHQDKLNCAMGTCIGETFNEIAEDFIMQAMSGYEVTTENVLNLRKGLVSFQEEYKVKEISSLIDKIDNVLNK